MLANLPAEEPSMMFPSLGGFSSFFLITKYQFNSIQLNFRFDRSKSKNNIHPNMLQSRTGSEPLLVPRLLFWCEDVTLHDFGYDGPICVCQR